MKLPRKTWFIVAAVALAAIPAQAQTTALHTEALQVHGTTDNMHLRYLRLDGGSPSEPIIPGSISLEGPEIRVEAWYQDSGGTPIAIAPTTQINVIAEGQVQALGVDVRETFQANFLSPTGAPLAWHTNFSLQSHSVESGRFPSFLAPTGEEIDADVSSDSAAIPSVPVGMTVHAPFTAAFWAWNFTVNGDSALAWSGDRPHGPGVGGAQPQGFDLQLLVFHVREGQANIQLSPSHVDQFFIANKEFRVDGKVAARTLTMDDGMAESELDGAFTILATRRDNETLEATITQQLPDEATTVEESPAAAPIAPDNPDLVEPQGAAPTPRFRDSGPFLSSVTATIATAMAIALAAYASRWPRLKKRFNDGDYRHVAQHAGKFHANRKHAGDAQLMTTVAAIKLGHYQLALHSLRTFGAIESGVHAILEGHALVGLGRVAEAERLLTAVRAASRQEEYYLAALDEADCSPAYS